MVYIIALFALGISFWLIKRIENDYKPTELFWKNVNRLSCEIVKLQNTLEEKESSLLSQSKQIKKLEKELAERCEEKIRQANEIEKQSRELSQHFTPPHPVKKSGFIPVKYLTVNQFKQRYGKKSGCHQGKCKAKK
jgi:DNA anti-recombination protein RmuC